MSGSGTECWVACTVARPGTCSSASSRPVTTPRLCLWAKMCRNFTIRSMLSICSKYFGSYGLPGFSSTSCRASCLSLFSTGSWVGAKWHPVSRGLAQGDPMSPLLAAAVMSVWTGTVARSTCEAVTFVDDRSFWGRSLNALSQAKRLSDRVDRAFQFRCDATKCLSGGFDGRSHRPSGCCPLRLRAQFGV